MRPIELTLDGFRSYERPATFSWEGRTLVGIVGPIGSGKSTILDGIAFALYGKTPRVERDVRSLINQHRDEGKVAFTFDVDGSRWMAIRALRRRGASAHTLYRVVDGEPIEEVDRAREMTERVSQVLGLDWDAFRRSVLLAQNQFAGFLEATGTQRNEVLKGVFAFDALDAMREAVKVRLDEAAGELTRLATLRGQAGRDRQELAEAVERRCAVAARLGALRETAGEAAALDERRTRAAAALDGAEADRRRLFDLAARLPDPTRVEDLLRMAAQASGRLAEAEAALASAKEAAETARVARDDAVEAFGGRERLERAAQLITVLAGERRASAVAGDAAERARDDLAAADRALRTAETEVTAAVGAAADAEAALAAASIGVERERAALHGARHRSMALTLRSDLVAGDRCPVCEQTVAQVPSGGRPPGVDDAERALAAAEESEAAARARVTETAAGLAGARTRVEESRRRVGQAKQAAADAERRAADAMASIEGSTAQLSAMLGDGDPEAVLADRRAVIAQADREAVEAHRALDEAREAREQVAAAAHEAREALARLATEAAAIVARLDADVDVDARPEVLEAALATIRAVWIEATAAADEAAAAAAAEMTEVAGARQRLLASAGLAPDAAVDAAFEEARTAVTAVESTIEILERRLADLDRLEAEERETLEHHATLERLHGDLAPSRFQAHVLDEYRRALADLGSEQFEVLSGGRYRFSDDGAFDVVDLTAAEQTRSADSLSGGETFLASLALALALAEMVARQGGRLDAFFLDEGFGSLDAEHLELAMEGVERLVAGADRLVVVVSHVGALRDRIEDLIELDKDPLRGTTRVSSGATIDQRPREEGSEGKPWAR